MDIFDKWNHYVFLNNATEGKIEMYLNGLLVAEMEGSISRQGVVNLFKIGSDKNGTGGFWEGRMDEFRIYNYALSHPEIVYLARGAGDRIFQPNLLPSDINNDCNINFLDFAILAPYWSQEILWP